jgi:phosphate transport system substrate-binding protein
VSLKRRTVCVLVSAAVVASLALVGCSRPDSASQTSILVTGSTTVLPIAEVAAEDFNAANPGKRVLASGNGSSEGILAVANGSAAIGTSSRDLKPAEAGLGLVDWPIARDAIAVVVNPSNPLDGLTRDQVAAIFEGRITNWKQVGGPDLEIGLVNRDEASGTREAFSKIVLKGADFDPTAAVLSGTGQVRFVVAQSDGAVGYISLGFADKSVKTLAVDGIVPTGATVSDGTYPVSRVLHFFTKGQPTGLTKSYIDYVLAPEIQETVVRDAGFLPISEGGQ